jgi:hypothetical protein
VRRNAACLALALATLTILAMPGRASDVVQIRLRGHYFSAPATVVVTVAIEPDADNRKLVIEADGPRFFRSSALELTGATAKRIHTIQFTNLPEGEYVLRAEVMSQSDVRGRAMQELTVTGPGGQ